MINQHSQTAIPTEDTISDSSPHLGESVDYRNPMPFAFQLDLQAPQLDTISNTSTASRISPLTSRLLDQEPSGDEASIDEEDPLQVKELAMNFDSLMNEINLKTEDLATKVYNHVEAKKYNNEINIEVINTKLQQMRNLILEANDLTTEIEKLDQLRLFSRDFKERLKIVSRTIKQSSKTQQR